MESDLVSRTVFSWVETMETCACCGQVIASPDRLTVQVDDDLLRLCNQAYGEAERRGANCVEIAHVVWCLTAEPGSGRWFEGGGLLRLAVATAAGRWLAGAHREGTPAALQASGELRALLSRSEQIANRETRDFAGPRDFVMALAEQSADLRSAAFAREGMRTGAKSSSYSGIASNHIAAPQKQIPSNADRRVFLASQQGLEARRGLDAMAYAPAPEQSKSGLRDSLRPAYQSHAQVPREPLRKIATAPPARAREGEQLKLPLAVGGARISGIEALLERLEQQEHDIDELRSLTARLLDRRRNGAGAGDASAGDASAGDASAGRSDRQGRSGGANNEGGREQDRSFRSRLRLRAGGWVMRDHTSAKEGGRAGSRGLAPPRGAARPVEVQEGARRHRETRSLGSQLSAPMQALPDNDAGDEAEGTAERLKRFYLSPDDDIVKAPSIGPRTAARLGSAGLMLVRDLLSCDPIEVATRVGARYMTADRIADWKAQARLVCTIPWLRGTHAQLLVGAGYDTIGKLVRADASVVCAAILRFAGTREGQSILRTGPAPEIDRIACWIENTALAEPARAA